MNLCTECNEEECPGIIICPQCAIGEHGASAATQIADHGMCRECQQNTEDLLEDVHESK